MQADPDLILADSSLARPALTLGKTIFADRCASCHGAAGKAVHAGIPDLTDKDWLYGSGRISEIEQITLHGIRSGDPKGWNLASMPAYATPRPYGREAIAPLRPGEIRDLAAFLVGLRGIASDPASATRGQGLYAGRGGCFDCHSPDAQGDSAIGAPNLIDKVWLYGDGSAGSLFRSVAYGRAGISPAFARTLTPVEARAVSVYVAALKDKP